MTASKQSFRYLKFKDNSPYRRFVQNGEAKVAQAGVTKESVSDVPAHGTYGGLLFHPKWKEKRKEILTRDRHQCVNCKSDKDLQVHHRQYHFVVSQNKFRLPWDYPDHLLITLCESCHSRGHNKYKVPTITV
jgi:uncharacterized protein (UPF0248 family)